jgi:hypothetical protein
MSIEKHSKVDMIEVTEFGTVQVRTVTRIIEDETVISQSYHRHVVCPGDDYSNEDTRVQAICAATHTPEVIEAYKAATAAQGV